MAIKLADDRAHKLRQASLLFFAGLLAASCGGSNGGPSDPFVDGGMTTSPPGDTGPPPEAGNPPRQPGQTDFTTHEPTNTFPGGTGAADAGAGAGSASPPGSAPAPSSGNMAPGGRMAEVQEGDIYKIDKNRLFYLNTYRGFLIYDLTDPKKPERVSRLPVHGYPIEMYVVGNTVYALLRDALYLTQVGDKPQFERHNVSQLVSIDVTDLRNPRVMKTVDIIGELREGVSRKVDNTIYVVSYIPQWYHWGWRADATTMKEQAWVYSFNVADPANLQKVGEYKIFEGGSVAVSDQTGSHHRTFSNVYISATANARMVAENWNVSASNSGRAPTAGRADGGDVDAQDVDAKDADAGAVNFDAGFSGCGSFRSTQEARVSLIDISNPTGLIKPHVDFWTEGQITDQFKMTYVNDEATKTGTFFGIVGRQVWSSSNCGFGSFTQNTLEAWDVSVAGKATRLDALDFGKPRETVRGTTFDTTRKVAFAITAEQIDPLYALDISNPRDLRVLSEIDGLSGDMTVFRLVGDNKFLLGIGRDTSDACTGFEDQTGWRSTKIAASLIDVQDLTKIRLVQRQCVAVKADWVSSGVTQNLDQAHKMLGMHADGTLNVLTVPVSYHKRVDEQRDWWFYRWETAVGLMSWDLTRYNPADTKPAVFKNHGTYIHPHGEVRRSIVFTHEAPGAKRRMMVNLSDTHVSVADIQDLDAPTAQSEIEVAPSYNQIYRFGDYLVEQVQSKPQSWGWVSDDVTSFRVRKAGGDLENAPVLKTMTFGQVSRVLKHDNSLVLFRQAALAPDGSQPNVAGPPGNEALVLDFSTPAAPRVAGKVTVPTMSVPYYRFWCGMGAYWGGYWFGQENNFATTSDGFTFLSTEWRPDGPDGKPLQVTRLVSLNVTNPNAPSVSEAVLPTVADQPFGAYGLVPDPVEPTGFFLTHRKRLGEVAAPNGGTFFTYKHFAQRWEPEGGKFVARHEMNTPGRLLRTWRSSQGVRMLLSQDTTYRQENQTASSGTNGAWFADQRLALLRQIDLGGKPAAELLGTHLLKDLGATSMLVEGDKLLLNARPQRNYFYGFGSTFPAYVPLTPGWQTSSDRLMIFDTSAA
ncbi:MAG TPA: beta-propeller domain-containing protein, partial [Polyangia bacterium]